MSAVVIKLKNLNFLRCCCGNFFNSWTDWSIKSLNEILSLKRDINVAGFFLSNNSFPSFISKRLTFKSKRIEIDEEVYYSSSPSWGGKMFLKCFLNPKLSSISERSSEKLKALKNLKVFFLKLCFFAFCDF